MPSDPPAADPRAHAVARARKQPYHAPPLTCLGSLGEATRTTANGNNTDGGGNPPEVYTS